MQTCLDQAHTRSWLKEWYGQSLKYAQLCVPAGAIGVPHVQAWTPEASSAASCGWVALGPGPGQSTCLKNCGWMLSE